MSSAYFHHFGFLMTLSRSDSSIRWFDCNKEAARQADAASSAAAAAPKTPSKSEDGAKKGKGKGSPKGKKKKGTKKDATNDDDENAPVESPFEGLWIVPGGCAAAAIDTASTSDDCVLIAAGEDGRVYLWVFPRKKGGELCFGRSRSTPDYVFQVKSSCMQRCCSIDGDGDGDGISKEL
jgi:hypothetical protein